MRWNPLTWFPWTMSGRQTSVYIAFAWSAPCLLATLVWILSRVEIFPDTTGLQRLAVYASIARLIAYGLLTILIAYACFVSVRAIKIAGVFDAQARDDNEDEPPEVVAAGAVVGAAAAKFDEIKIAATEAAAQEQTP